MFNSQAELACRSCGYTSVCGPGAMLDWLRKAKMVRRGVEPEPDLLAELLRAAAPKLHCPQCGAAGLVVRPVAVENDEEWGMARACDACGRPIARDRLEVVPDATMCVDCQARADRGESATVAEYCPRCGNLMVVRQSRTAGVTRYVQACPKCHR